MDIQQQMKMQQVLKAKGELEADYFEKRLMAEKFPASKLSASWKENVKKAILRTAPLMLKISISEYVSVIEALPGLEKGDDLTLFEFGVLSNSLETKSPEELGLSGRKYAQFMSEVLDHIQYYQKRVQVIRDEVKKKVETDINMKLASDDKRNPLKPVKAEA